ncbi:AAA family ATPase [Amycolatopsis sp. K13G38]|uniref:AAA family ATPase n=1 Tax=Amycolatopsis acididurans TaxID=2724524 RepID=A0ABX1JFQ3_9PSEU|nr:BTAD domain-containing putative transcriptional regulator [Amycolatopsis acididurans]NKQ58618.1 AAA family ATPase [Amycolatopsis acididurans]
MRFGVLGPLVAEDAGGPVALPGPRHRAVLARLIVARGRVVPVERIVDDLWERPPERAAGAVQTFVAALRRELEPDRPPRTPARLLITEGRGYALRAESVDAWEFETAVTEAGQLLAKQQAGTALDRVDEALRLWRGPAYAEFDDQAWARAEITRLGELRLLARERRAGALLALGRAAEAVPDLDAHTSGHPWREDAWRLLALALYRAGRQGEALAALRTARQVLADDLGIDPGPALRTLESDILAQTPELLPAEVRTPLVARAPELDRLAEAAAATRARGKLGLALISGDAGAGKTALAEAFAARLGWTTAWGDNPEDAPAAWAWTRILSTLGLHPEPEPAADPAVARFHWHRAVGQALAGAAPLLVVLDDLHWAGEETLALLASVVTDPVAAPVLVIGTYRTSDVAPRLTELLGRVARSEPTRIYLGGLPASAVPVLVRATTGQDIDTTTATAIHRRSGGNPFFVRELARLLDAEGHGALDAVPPGVRDLVRYRVARLPGDAQAVLRQAAVLGTEVDLGILGEESLDALELAAARGFLTEEAPGRFRFAHALVRDTVYEDMSRSRRAHEHTVIGERIQRLRPDDVGALAHHFSLAGDARAAGYARAAAEQAESRFAPHEAARLWRAALTAYDGPDMRVRLDLLMGLVRALAVTGELDQARRHRAEAIAMAEALDEPALTARVIAAFDVPAVWTEHDDPALARRIAEVTERTLAALPPENTVDRGRLLATLALELRSAGGARAREAARESEAIARELDDPALLAFALNARFMQSFGQAGLAPRRARIGTELVELSARHGMVGFEVLGRLILIQARSALADFAAADEQATTADRLGEDYQLPLVGVFTQWYRALRASVRGEDAEPAYRAAAGRLSRTAMSGMDNGLGGFALFCHRLRRGAVSAVDTGAFEPWCRPLRQDTNEEIPESPRDLLYEARTALHAVVALRRGDRPAMERLYADLLPAQDELAGAGSGLLTLAPVATYLGELAAALGRPGAAADHHRRAREIGMR